MGIILSEEDKQIIVEINKLSDMDGFLLLKTYFYKSIMNSISITTTEKDIAFYAGQKSVFEHVEKQCKLLENYNK